MVQQDMETGPKEEKRGYVYSFAKGQLKETLCRQATNFRGLVIFHEIKENGMDGMRYQCSRKEGVILNNQVWFHEPNKELAARLLAEEIEREINQYIEKAAALKSSLQYLQSIACV